MIGFEFYHDCKHEIFAILPEGKTTTVFALQDIYSHFSDTTC